MAHKFALSINRIRLEFKVATNKSVANLATVLIESDWNLKRIERTINRASTTVLIESDWNLKQSG